jgi:hypothetical protein
MLSVAQDIVSQLTPYQNAINNTLDIATSLPLVGKQLADLNEWNTVFQDSVTSLASRVDSLTNGHFELAVPLPSLSKTFTFDLGLDAFLQVKTSGGVSAAINPVLNVGFDLTNGVPSLDPTHTGLDIGFVIGLPNFQLTASLNGKLYAQAVDDGTTFSGNLGFNFDTNFNIKANFSGDAHVRLGLSVSLVDPALNASFNPRFSTDLELDWGFDTQGDQLKVPVIAFRNFSLDADSFMQGFLGDTVKGVQKFTKPMQPFIDMFEQPVPIVSSFDSSETMGDLFLKGAGLSEAQQDSFNTMVKIVKAVNTFDFSGTTGGAVINFGDILLTGDARQTGQFFFDTTQLQGVIDDIMNSPALQEVQDKLETVAEYVGFTADAGFKYPLLENPGPVIGSLLTGQTEIMFSYSTGRQHFKLGVSDGVGIPNLLGFFLNAGVVFDASLSVGYDTQGLLKFIQDQRPEDLLHGFYIDNSIDNTGLPIPNVPNPRKSSLYLQGYADISASAVVTVSGGLYADIAFELASNSVSTHVYLDDIITSLSNNVKVFNPSGRLYAAANIELTVPNPVGPDITLFKYALSSQELLSFNLPPAPTQTLPLTVIDDVTNQHSLLLDVTKMKAGGSVKVQPFHDFTITSGVGYAGDGIRVDYPNEIVLYVERKNDITSNYYNFIGLSGAVPDGVSIDIVDPFTVFAAEGAPDPQPPQTESGVLLAGGKNVVYKYAENAAGSLATVLLVGGYGSNSLAGGTMIFGNFVPAVRIDQAKNHFGNLTGFDAAGQAYINARIDSVLAPASPTGIIGATMTSSRGGLMFGGPGNNSFYATGPGDYDMVGGAWTNNFTISPSFNGVPATYQIDGGPFGQSTLTVRVPSGENVSFDNSAIIDKYTPTLKALAIQANAGLSATAHGIRKVQIVAAVGSDVQLGDTSELDIAFTIVGASRLSFGGSNAPDTFSVSSDYNFYGRKDLRYVRQLASTQPYVGNDDIQSGIQNGNLHVLPPGNFGRTSQGEWTVIPPFPVDRVESPVYAIVRTFGTNGRTQTVDFKVDNPLASSLKLDGKGASDTYNITQGLGSFLDIEVRDSDLSTRNTVNVDFRHPGLLPQQATLTNNVLRLNYFTPITHFTDFWWNGGFFDYLNYFHFYSTSVAYAPGVFFGANVDITLRTGRPFQETIIDRSNPPTGQLATILFDGVLDAYEPPGVLGWDADYISSPSQLGYGRYQARGDFWRNFFQPNVIAAAYDTQNPEAGVIPVDSNIANVKVLANAGNLLIGQGAHTYDVLGNSGTVSMQFTGLYYGRTVNIAGNSGTVNIHEAVVGFPALPGWSSLQVNVDNNGSLAGINGAINLTNASGVVSLKIDDRTNPGPSTSWTVDAMKTVIGDLTINYAGLNPAPLQNDFGSAYDAFPKAGQVINYNAAPPFWTRRLNGLILPQLGLFLSSPWAQLFQQAGVPVSAQLYLYTNQPPNTPLTYSATGLPPGLSVNPTTGLFSGVIAPQAYLTNIFNTTFSATTGGVVVQTKSITIQWVVSSGINIDIPSVFDNEPGVEGTPPPNQPLTALNQFNLPVTFTSATGLPPGITFNPATATFGGTFAPGAAQNGPYTVTINATDGFETSSTTFDWHVTAINLVVPPTQLSRHGEAIDLLLQASLIGGGSPMLQINGLPTGLTFNPATKRITGVIDVNASRVSQVSITATNGAESIFKQFFWITLPVGVANYISLEEGPGNKFFHEGEDVSWYLPRAYNSLGLPLTYTITGLPPGLAFQQVNADIHLFGTIASGSAANSPYHVQLHVTDGFSSDTANFDLSVAVRGSVSLPYLPYYSRTSTQGATIGFTFYPESSLNETITFAATGLPPGITINPQTGFVSGQLELLAAIPGRFQVKVTATTASGSDSFEFLWHVIGDDENENILSLPNPSGTGVVTVTSPVGTEISASVSDQAGVAIPNGVSFPFGFVTFMVQGLAPGQAADVIIAGLDLSGIEDYYKYGATPANSSEHWYNFLFGQATDDDSAVGTGIEIVGGNLVLHLVDGGRGDDDTSKNGVIFDIGGPAIVNTSTPPATIVARQLFYNQSGTSTRYDHNDLAINSFDDLAIATDKTAYLWEDAGAATFANVSSYSKGINGIMVDISGSHPSITAADFIFKVGNNNSPGLWGTANAPTSVSVRAGGGVGGSDRVEIIWNGAAAPIKQWLEVIVLANANTGLAQEAGHPAGHGDAFFFGNAVGDTGFGDTAANSLVTAVDESAIRANPALLRANIPITNIYDVDRNAQVNANDQNIARLNATNSTTVLEYINLTTAPAAPEAASADEGDGGEISPLVATDDSGVASALTASAPTSGEVKIPGWLANRLDSIDLNSRIPAKVFQHLHDVSPPGTRALRQTFDADADALGLNGELLDLLLADLGLE